MSNASIKSSNTSEICQFFLSWDQITIDSQRPILYVSIIAIIIHSIFWLQLIFCPTVRQKNMQWLYAYLLTDILLLCRFFFLFIVHTTSTQCTPSASWHLFVCYIEAIVDNYLNILEAYILLALNICRYAQIAHNKNVYLTSVRWLTVAHLMIYTIPLLSFIVQLLVGWTQLVQYADDTCDILFPSLYAQIFNTVTSFVLPIILNLVVIYMSARHIHLTSRLRQGQHHVSAREKYHRSLIIQFVVFYAVWILLWSPNVITYQFTSGTSTITTISRLLNFIEIALDPIIIAALDARFRHVWCDLWKHLNRKCLLKSNRNQRRIAPNTIVNSLQTHNHLRRTAL